MGTTTTTTTTTKRTIWELDPTDENQEPPPRKKYKRKTWLCHRAKDTDQIQDELEHAASNNTTVQASIPFDDDLPGGGQFYCAETGKHFIDAKALADHKKSRYYKRRCKELKEEKYTQDVADWAGGMSKEKLPPAHAK